MSDWRDPANLPIFGNTPIPVEIGGLTFTVRSLTRGEAMALAQLPSDDVVKLETSLIALACDIGLHEVEDWYNRAPAGVVGTLVAAILDHSGLSGDLGNG